MRRDRSLSRFRSLAIAFGVTLGAGLAGVMPGDARAETVKLKNGYQIDGWIVEEDEAELVLAVIRSGTVGTMKFQKADVAEISRERGESLEAALMRERARMEAEARAREQEEAAKKAAEEARARAEGRAPAAPAAGEAGAAGATQPLSPAAAATAEEEGLVLIVEEPTAEEAEAIDGMIYNLGATRADGAGFRRSRAINDLAQVGAKAVPKLTKALEDETNAYRRMNAARALLRIAQTDTRLGLYLEAAPALVERLDDGIGYVRQYANEALEAISGERYGIFDTQGEDNPWLPSKPSSTEREVVEAWEGWWKGVAAKIQTAGDSGEASAPDGTRPG